MTRDITVDVELPHPPSVVWQALTDPAALAEWLMPVEDFAPVVGQRFTVRAKPVPGWDGVVHCEVTAVECPHVLAYTWRGSKMRTTTTVTWTLTPLESDRTRLVLAHNGFPGLGGAVLAFMHHAGWRKMISVRLVKVLAGYPVKE
jgi:uncharacterized protein YndB with AHSA1/START domain